MKTGHATIEFAGNGFFVATTPSGHAQVLDVDGQRSAASGPLELLLIALGGCTGADVISVLHKKRENVTSYRIEVRGERREEHPRSFRRLEVRHIVRGRGVSEKAVAQAIQLSTEKYCSVAATLRPTAEIVWTYEIQEEAEKAEAPAPPPHSEF
jgi:putative redox protein